MFSAGWFELDSQKIRLTYRSSDQQPHVIICLLEHQNMQSLPITGSGVPDEVVLRKESGVLVSSPRALGRFRKCLLKR